MADALGRTVMHRDRYGRVWGLGDRKAPASQTPGLVLMEDDPSLPLAYAPFTSSTTDALPAVLRMASRGAFSPPEFGSAGPTYEVNVGHVLPPSLEDANAGEAQGTSNLLPVSWQRMNHDDTLTDPMLLPEIVVLTDAVQLASQPGKLPTAVMTLKHRFPGALLWTPGLGGPDNLGVLVSMGVDLFDLARCREAAANAGRPRASRARSPAPDPRRAARASMRCGIFFLPSQASKGGRPRGRPRPRKGSDGFPLQFESARPATHLSARTKWRSS